MTDLMKTKPNGQWELLSKSEYKPEKGMPHTTIHFSDGTKKHFPYKKDAITHLMINGHLNTDDTHTNFKHVHEPTKTAYVQGPYDKPPKANPSKRKDD